MSSSSWRSSAAGRKAAGAGGYAGAARDQGTECQATPRGARANGRDPGSQPQSVHTPPRPWLQTQTSSSLSQHAQTCRHGRSLGGGPHTSQSSPNSAMAGSVSVRKLAPAPGAAPCPLSSAPRSLLWASPSLTEKQTGRKSAPSTDTHTHTRVRGHTVSQPYFTESQSVAAGCSETKNKGAAGRGLGLGACQPT